MEEAARAQGRSLADMSLQEMDGLWNDIKSKDKAAGSRDAIDAAYKQQKTMD
jgi:hypothetical protein